MKYEFYYPDSLTVSHIINNFQFSRHTCCIYIYFFFGYFSFFFISVMPLCWKDSVLRSRGCDLPIMKVIVTFLFVLILFISVLSDGCVLDCLMSLCLFGLLYVDAFSDLTMSCLDVVPSEVPVAPKLGIG